MSPRQVTTHGHMEHAEAAERCGLPPTNIILLLIAELQEAPRGLEGRNHKKATNVANSAVESRPLEKRRIVATQTWWRV